MVDNYKIVKFYYPDFLTQEQQQYFSYDMVYGVEVFSLMSGSWKELELGDLHYMDIFAHTANVNGTMFWYGSGPPFEMLIAFDIATEVFTLTSLDTFSANVDVQEYGDCPHRVYLRMWMYKSMVIVVLNSILALSSIFGRFCYM